MALLAASGEPSWTAGGDGLAGDHAEGCSDGSAHVPLGQPKDVLRVSEARLEGEKDRPSRFSFDKLAQNFEIRKSRMNLFVSS